MVDYNGSYYAYVHTLQGDIAAIVDNTGTKVVEYGYDAWGKPTKAWSLTHSSESTLTSVYAKLAQLNPFCYRGYVWDEEIGLYSLGSRYYDPAWGRFLNADAILETDGSPLAHNPFSYCRNLPIANSDPEGFYALLSGAVGSIIGTVIGLTGSASLVPDVVSALKEAVRWYSAGQALLSKTIPTADSRPVAIDQAAALLSKGNYYYAFMDNKTNSVFVFPVPALTIEQAAAITSPEAWGEYANYAGGPNVGVYTLEWYNAMALAHRVGTRIPIPEEHSNKGPGIYYYHFHSENHGTHIWYGAPIIKP